MTAYASCKYLIYTCWETTSEQGGKIAGSLIHPLVAQTEAEAAAHIATLAEQGAAFDRDFPEVARRETRRYVYILNRPEWWPGSGFGSGFGSGSDATQTAA
jgi:hypothetical protein